MRSCPVELPPEKLEQRFIVGRVELGEIFARFGGHVAFISTHVDQRPGFRIAEWLQAEKPAHGVHGAKAIVQQLGLIEDQHLLAREQGVVAAELFVIDAPAQIAA